MTRIKSIALYPQTYKPIMKSDPPEGCALAGRYHNPQYPITGAWPEVAIGEEIEIETDNHWIWRATLEGVRSADFWVVRIIGEKQPMPLPPFEADKPYVLPYMSGDAWSVRPEKGKVLTIGGQHYKVTLKPRSVRAGYEYRLEPVSSEAQALAEARKAAGI